MSYDELLATANTVAPTYEPNRVPEPLPVGVRTYAVLHGGTATPTPSMRQLDGLNVRREAVYRLVCVGNTSEAARRLANAMTDAIDGAPWYVVYVSEPLEDRGDQSGVSWSSTVEIHHHHRRA